MNTAEELLLDPAAYEPTETPALEAPPPAPVPDEEPPSLPRSRLLAAAALAALSVAWMLGGIFEGSLARVLGVAAVVAGVGVIGLVARFSRAAAAEYVLLPAAFLAAALAAVALPNATGSTGTVLELVKRAIRNGGLLQPPVPFDPGWRFLVVFLLVVAAGALASFALSTRRPMVVPALVVPFVFGAGLLQAEGSELVSTMVSLAAVAGALMVLYTAEVAGETGGARFEAGQIARGAVALVAVCALVAGLSKADVLFPDADRIITPKPQKPQITPLSAVPDRVLFRVRSDREGPWRLGVLDSYDDQTWLLPPLDPDRLAMPGAADALAGATAAGDERANATFTVAGLEGFTIPSLSNPVAVDAPAARVDTRTQTVRVTGSSPGRGFTYTVDAIVSPGGQTLAKASGAVPPALARFTELPPPPPGVAAALADAPRNPWERLQFLRARLYAKVVAAGSGVPIAVPPARVDAMLAGADATPYEITAAEAMLARWAGVPARIGYGFHKGNAIRGGYEVRPRHGANWLEAWFPGHGWVPVVGTPPRARASLSSTVKNDDVVVKPSDDLTLQVYIPLQQQNPLLLYVVIRYWLAVASPFVLAALLLWAFHPALLKSVRARRRRRWAAGRGPQARIAVAYAEFRDRARDLNAGDPYDTPLEYLDRIAADDEHIELAWLVTRALWGDLTRGLTDDDAAQAEEMSRSLRRRLARAQTPLTRLLSHTSRSSLREPYDSAIPAVKVGRARLRRLVAASMVGLVACGGAAEALPEPALPARILPASIEGYEVRSEPTASKAFRTSYKVSLVADGVVHTMRRDGEVMASLQTSVLKRRFSTDDEDVRRGIRASIERGDYRWFKVEGQWVGEQRLTEIGLYLWMPEGGQVYNVLVAKPDLGIPRDLLSAIIAYQRTGP